VFIYLWQHQMVNYKDSYIVHLNPKHNLQIHRHRLRISKAFGPCFISTCHFIITIRHRLRLRSILSGKDEGRLSAKGIERLQLLDAYFMEKEVSQYYKSCIYRRICKATMFFS